MAGGGCFCNPKSFFKYSYPPVRNEVKCIQRKFVFWLGIFFAFNNFYCGDGTKTNSYGDVMKLK